MALSVVLPSVGPMPASSPVQPSFDDLGTHLSQVTFCVVDLETTGGGKDCSITDPHPADDPGADGHHEPDGGRRP